MRNKIWIILASLAVLLFITNPTVSDFREHFGKEKEKEEVRRVSNFIIFSFYDFDNIQKTAIRQQDRYGTYYYKHILYTSKYLGIGANFILLSEKRTEYEIYLSNEGEKLQEY